MLKRTETNQNPWLAALLPTTDGVTYFGAGNNVWWATKRRCPPYDYNNFRTLATTTFFQVITDFGVNCLKRF
ncbi:MAG: hypothetical protein DRR19_06325 [Candidatus Parabeggiatoa sp. nov. 1]|nr:MAG: hypothetical protein DRR19_06325 [Gammaproteobacteria bacterium]